MTFILDKDKKTTRKGKIIILHLVEENTGEKLSLAMNAKEFYEYLESLRTLIKSPTSETVN